jgi:hypothetical protein
MELTKNGKGEDRRKGKEREWEREKKSGGEEQ